MARIGKTRRPNRVRATGINSKNPKVWKKEIDFCKIVPTANNYGKIAKGLRIKLGPKAPGLHKQLEDKGLSKNVCDTIDDENTFIDALYACGYDVEDLYAQLVGRIQDEILKQLPF